MSYDLRVAVKVEGCDKYADIIAPEYDSPTYNLSEMFRACMNWDYEQGEYYPAKDYLPIIVDGIAELMKNPKKYDKYNPSNGWGSRLSAIESLESWVNCIHDTVEVTEIPLECLYIRW